MNQLINGWTLQLTEFLQMVNVWTTEYFKLCIHILATIIRVFAKDNTASGARDQTTGPLIGGQPCSTRASRPQEVFSVCQIGASKTGNTVCKISHHHSMHWFPVLGPKILLLHFSHMSIFYFLCHIWVCQGIYQHPLHHP